MRGVALTRTLAQVGCSPSTIAAFVLALLATLVITFASAVYFFPKRNVTFDR
jgi:hypothetical protein